MINTQFLDDLSQKIRELANGSPAADVEKNFRALLQGAFTKLELVSREEFDVQADILRHTREKLVELEKKLAALEDVLHKNNN
ncbi:Ubiquinone biosynthesis accessory factor UbiK [Methylophilaceae bacterium]|nr:Ubiquinone biosynthesis accessory factor UbiK [Methylophilaceae bacterium]